MIAKYNNLKVEIIGGDKYDYLIQLDERPNKYFTTKDVLRSFGDVFKYEQFYNLKGSVTTNG